MGDKSGINWTDATWNPVTGCDKVSPGCDHCYALTMAKRLKGMGVANYQTDGDPVTSGPGFGIAMHPNMLDRPLRWTRPRRIFVNSMSDLFHSGVTREFQAEVFAVMAAAERHTFQVLTKRPGVMRSVLSSDDFVRMVNDAYWRLDVASDEEQPWPLPNVHVGTSVEDQDRAFRIDALVQTPAASRFLSLEPLLGPVQLCNCYPGGFNPETYEGWQEHCRLHGRNGVDWVIVGGESGRGARPMDLDWVRLLRDEVEHSPGVAFWYKQQGTGDGGDQHRRELDGRTWDEFPAVSA